VKNIITLTTVFFLLITMQAIQAAQLNDSAKVRKWQIGNDLREAIVYVPLSAKNKPAPVIFVFHGHGGNMKDMFNGHRFDQLWPEAIIVVPQGMKTPGQLVDRAGKLSGWQQAPGDMNDRDIHFFDEILLTIRKEYQVNNKRIYATGHSNGGSFTYLLWAMRGNVFAAMAPSAAVAFRFNEQLTPKPVMHIMGEKDLLVKPSWQQMEIAKLLKLNKCSATGRPYAANTVVYPSSLKAPVLVCKHSGGHIYPPDADAIVIKFFKSIIAVDISE